MTVLPAKVRDLLVRPESVKMLITADLSGQPRGIVCGSIFVPDEETLAVGEVFMNVTKGNLENNHKAAVTVALGGFTDHVAFNIPTSMLLWMICAVGMAARGAVPEQSHRNKMRA